MGILASSFVTEVEYLTHDDELITQMALGFADQDLDEFIDDDGWPTFEFADAVNGTLHEIGWTCKYYAGASFFGPARAILTLAAEFDEIFELVDVCIAKKDEER